MCEREREREREREPDRERVRVTERQMSIPGVYTLRRAGPDAAAVGLV